MAVPIPMDSPLPDEFRPALALSSFFRLPVMGKRIWGLWSFCIVLYLTSLLRKLVSR